jgi:hypothetical protein
MVLVVEYIYLRCGLAKASGEALIFRLRAAIVRKEVFVLLVSCDSQGFQSTRRALAFRLL